MLRIGRGKAAGQHMGTAGDGQGGVAPLDVLVGEEVAGLVDQGGVEGHGLLRGADRRQHLVLHLDHPLGLLQDLLALGGHNADGVSQVVGHASHGNHGIPVLGDVANLILAGDILGGKHPHHPGHGPGLVGVDRPDNGPGWALRTAEA